MFKYFAGVKSKPAAQQLSRNSEASEHLETGGSSFRMPHLESQRQNEPQSSGAASTAEVHASASHTRVSTARSGYAALLCAVIHLH